MTTEQDRIATEATTKLMRRIENLEAELEKETQARKNANMAVVIATEQIEKHEKSNASLGEIIEEWKRIADRLTAQRDRALGENFYIKKEREELIGEHKARAEFLEKALEAVRGESVEAKRILILMEHENLRAQREMESGGWLCDHTQVLHELDCELRAILDGKGE